MPRLTDKQKSEIITEYVSGKSQSEIARKFKVSPTAISKTLQSITLPITTKLKNYCIINILWYNNLIKDNIFTKTRGDNEKNCFKYRRTSLLGYNFSFVVC